MEDRPKPRWPTLELIGGGLGLIMALVVGGMRLLGGSNPLRRQEEAFGSVILLLIFATPYVAALLSTRLPAGTRWAVLLPSALLSLTSVWMGIASVGIFFLPVVIILFIAAGSSIGQRRVSKSASRMITIVAVVTLATVFGAFLSLFRTQDARAWTYATYEDGHTEWQSQPVTPGRLGISGRAVPGSVASGGTAVSDIITNSEATTAGGLLLLAWVEIGGLGWYAARRFPDESVDLTFRSYLITLLISPIKGTMLCR